MKLKVNGDLNSLVEFFVDNFDGSIAGGHSGLVTFSGGFPYGAILSGRTLEVPTHGRDFLTGTVTRIEFNQMDLSNGYPEFTDLLVFTGIKASASELFDLVDRTPKAAKGRFDEGAFQDVLKGDWKILGGSGNDLIAPGRMALAGDDRISGGAGDDLLHGGKGHDTVMGGWGNDTLVGSTGNDTLAGGFGDDDLYGGAGADIFVFAAAGGADEVIGFEVGQDRLDLGAAGAFQIVDTLDGARIDFDGGSVLLRGVAAAALGDDLFV